MSNFGLAEPQFAGTSLKIIFIKIVNKICNKKRVLLVQKGRDDNDSE
jgi:hypothetical protein